MATNEILEFAASATGADILTQANYVTDTDRTIGHQVGTARQELENKVLRQTSLISAAVAQFMADRQSNNIVDTDTASTVAGYLATAISDYTCPVVVGGGTADVITATFSPALASLTNKTIVVRATAPNATTTPTLNANGLGAKTIVKANNIALRPGDIAGAGHWCVFNYDAALGNYVLQNPADVAASETVAGIQENATQAEVNSGVSNKTVCPDTLAASDFVSIGINQTWQDMTASRTSGVSYTNTTGRPIMVSGKVVGIDTGLSLTVSGLVIQNSSTVGATGNDVNSVCGIVPAGATYTLTFLGGGGATLYWYELR